MQDIDNPPDDVATLEIDGKQQPYIVRQELGTINRFIYSIFMLTPQPGTPEQPDLSVWNQNLIFHFGGGVGVGHSQSENNSYVSAPDGRDENVPLLERGYAIVSSTGNVAATTYNLLLMGQTAKMVKQQFGSAYATPEHTFGLGGSGGAIQQYVFEQNNPDLLDALFPFETFGDMITQIDPVGDCELLEFYFDKGNAAVNGTGTGTVNPKWTDWENRQWIEGLNAINGAPTAFDQGDGRPIGSSAQPGSSEFIEGWRGLSPLVLNPHFVTGDSYDVIRQTEPDVFAKTRFDYFDDLKDIFGSNPETGFARTTYDNVGVQYGLAALNKGRISVKEFLLLNAHVGGYVDTSEQVPEGFPFGPMSAGIDPWSSRNATARKNLAPDAIAPRTEGDLAAMRAAYSSGVVFRGDIDAPMLILDEFKEPELNMHDSREKFEIRQRMLNADGDASNLVLWAVDGDNDAATRKLLLQGLNLLETWLDDGMKPTRARDACFMGGGSEIARGEGVWNGILTGDPADDGRCVADFPIYDNARIIVGEKLTGYTFKCALKPVDTALTDGTYVDSVAFTDEQKARLRAVFADGVCDYSQPDRARPDG